MSTKTIKLKIYDGAIPLLDQIAKISRNQGLDALDHAGIVLRENTRQALKNTTSSNWYQRVIKGKRTIIRGSHSNKYSARFSRTTGLPSNTQDMSSFITSYLMEGKLILVVAGKHKTTIPKKRRNGKVVGSFGRLTGVSVQSHEILKKLNNGGRLSRGYTKAFRGRKKSLFGDNIRYTGSNFIETGRSQSMSRVTDIMTTKLNNMIIKQVNNTSVKSKEYR